MGFDTFCPVGTPAPPEDVDRAALSVTTRVNGEVKQDGLTSDTVFDIPTLIAHISGAITLEPGDLIATGTPDGIGPLSPSDEVVIEVQGVGSATNPVLAGD